jgi:hypothetical protein
MIIFWWFWDRLSEEFERVRGKPEVAASEGCLGRMVLYGFGGTFIAFVVLIIVMYVIVAPLRDVYRITTRGDVVHFESLYRS